VAGGWRRLHSKNFTNCTLHQILLPYQIKDNEIGEHVARMGHKNAYNILVGKSERKIPHRRAKCKWEDSIRKYLRGKACEGADWIHLAQYRDRWWAPVKRK
jgi:hypothetical protein